MTHDYEKDPPRDGDHGTGAEQDPRQGSPELHTPPGADDQGNPPPPPPPRGRKPRKPGKRKSRDGYPHGEHYDEHSKVIDVYFYPLADGAPYGMVKRCEGKQFPQFHYEQRTQLPDTNNDRNWIPGEPKPKIPYNLPELSKAAPGATVYYTEGEKDADTLIDLRLLGTCHTGGASYVGKEGKIKGWSPELVEYYRGRHVVLLEDNDPDGKRHLQIVARQLKGVAASIKVVRFRDLPEHSDVTDWCEQRAKELFGEEFKWLSNEQRAILRDELLARAEDWIDEEAPVDIDELLERAKSDPSAPFEPDMVKGLARLKIDEPAKYESLRAKLKTLVRIGELDKLVNTEVAKITGGSKDKRTQADILLELAHEADLFHTAEGVGYADVEISEHRETWAIDSKGFKLWLTQRFHEETHKAPSAETFKAVLNVIEAEAQFDGPERKVHVRSAGHKGKIYVDLCDQDWRAVEISAEGWRIVNNPPVRFRRAKGMLALPVPFHDGSIEKLRQFLNVANDNDFVLAVAFLLMALKDNGPYVILALLGEQGAAKSFFARLMRGLVDPNVAMLRTLSRNDHELALSSRNSHVQAFDNISSLAPWMADALCRLATGSGFATRQLYENTEEVLFDSCRPIILNGIEGFITRADLGDRCLLLTLKEITEENRKLENQLMQDFEQEAPRILGALFDAMSHGLRELPNVRLGKLPRMADFFMWISACEGALWEKGTFANAYEANRGEMAQRSVEADHVAGAIVEMMHDLKENRKEDKWEGSTKDLLETLDFIVNPNIRGHNSWPKTPRALSSRLARIIPPLRKIGVDITTTEDSHTKRTHIVITLKEQPK